MIEETAKDKTVDSDNIFGIARSKHIICEGEIEGPKIRESDIPFYSKGSVNHETLAPLQSVIFNGLPVATEARIEVDSSNNIVRPNRTTAFSSNLVTNSGRDSIRRKMDSNFFNVFVELFDGGHLDPNFLNNIPNPNVNQLAFTRVVDQKLFPERVAEDANENEVILPPIPIRRPVIVTENLERITVILEGNGLIRQYQQEIRGGRRYGFFGPRDVIGTETKFSTVQVQLDFRVFGQTTRGRFIDLVVTESPGNSLRTNIATDSSGITISGRVANAWQAEFIIDVRGANNLLASGEKIKFLTIELLNTTGRIDEDADITDQTINDVFWRSYEERLGPSDYDFADAAFLLLGYTGESLNVTPQIAIDLKGTKLKTLEGHYQKGVDAEGHDVNINVPDLNGDPKLNEDFAKKIINAGCDFEKIQITG